MQDEGKDRPDAGQALERVTPDPSRHPESSPESAAPSFDAAPVDGRASGGTVSHGAASHAPGAGNAPESSSASPSGNGRALGRSGAGRRSSHEAHHGGPTITSWTICTILIVIDQVTKLLADRFLVPGEPVPIIEGLFNLTLVYNPGAAFGMFGNLPDPYRRFVLAFVSLVALMVVVRFMIREARHDRISQLALVAILSGAVGNIIDRVRLDAVIDFLDFYWGNHHWPAFNVADSAISIGVTVLMLRVLFGRRMFHETKPALEAATAKQP